MQEVALQVEGTRVYAQSWLPKGKPRAGVVLLHGFNASVGEFGTLGQDLAAAGYAVLAFDQRGHGLSAGERGLFSLDRALQDTEVAVTWLRGKLGRKVPLVLVGHSLGGALAVGIAARTRWFRLLITAHPVDRLLDELHPVARLAYHGIARVGRWRQQRGKPAGMLLRPPSYRHLYVDRAAARQAAKEPYLAKHINLASYTFASTMQPSAWAKHVRIPALAILSPHDRTVDPKHSDRVVDNLAGPVERLYHQGGHACFRDHDKDRVTEGIVAFLRQHAETT